jgi:hypothetical protein
MPTPAESQTCIAVRHNGSMADDDIERLLREVAATSGSPTGAGVPATRPDSSPARAEAASRGIGRLGFAAGSAVVLGGATWFLGLMLPFTSAVSAGIGGATAAFVTALVAGPPRWFDS